jgi:hypothetical protein
MKIKLLLNCKELLVAMGEWLLYLMTLGGKGLKFVVNAEETPVFVKSKASKKLG